MRGPYAAMAALLVLSPLAVTKECHSDPFYSAKSFRGDGKIEDNGLWTTPRYVISLPEIPLNRPGKYTYSVRGLPRELLNFGLRVAWHSETENLSASQSRLRNLTSSAKVNIRITDERGNVLCEHSEPLSQWGPSVTPDNATYSDATCTNIQFRSNGQYRVVIRVDCPEKRATKVMAKPVLEGGGIELP